MEYTRVHPTSDRWYNGCPDDRIPRGVTMDRVRVVLPLPPGECSPNARVHYMAKAAAVRGYRSLSEEMGRMVAPDEPWSAAMVRIEFFHKDKRRRDPDNGL